MIPQLSRIAAVLKGAFGFVTANRDPVTGRVEISGQSGPLDIPMPADAIVGEVLRKTSTGWETAGHILGIDTLNPVVGDVPYWDGTNWINTPSGIKLAKQTGGTFIPTASYTDIPGCSVSLGNIQDGSLVAVFFSATMKVVSGTVTVALSNGGTSKQGLSSTSTAGEARAIMSNSTTGVVQDGFAGVPWVLPIDSTGGVTLTLQARHTSATGPEITNARLRAWVLAVPGV